MESTRKLSLGMFKYLWSLLTLLIFPCLWLKYRIILNRIVIHCCKYISNDLVSQLYMQRNFACSLQYPIFHSYRRYIWYSTNALDQAWLTFNKESIFIWEAFSYRLACSAATSFQRLRSSSAVQKWKLIVVTWKSSCQRIDASNWTGHRSSQIS